MAEGEKETNPLKPVTGGALRGSQERLHTLQGHRRLVFTSAQNNTDVHHDFLSSLESYCEHEEAKLVIAPFSYNKNAWRKLSDLDETTPDDGNSLGGFGAKGDLWYHPRLHPHLDDTNYVIDKTSIRFSGALDILPTAVNPISGLVNYNQGRSHIIPHPQVRQQAIPSAMYAVPEFVWTTGCCTLKNYIQRKAGQKAEFHHTFAALVVEVGDAGEWWARHLIADNSGRFTDLGRMYHPDGRVENSGIRALSYEAHIEKGDSSLYAILANIITLLQPDHVFVHDLVDFEVRNHHNIKDPDFRYRQWHRGDESVDLMFDMAGHHVNDIMGLFDGGYHVCRSNHDMAVERWLREADWKNDPVNMETFLKLKLRQIELLKTHQDPNMLGHMMLDRLDAARQERFHLYDQNGSLKIDNVELAVHGHVGINGRPATINSMQNIGSKITYGHTHTAGRAFGVVTLGVLARMDMGYNPGYSTWSPTICLQDILGKRQLVTFRPQGYRLW